MKINNVVVNSEQFSFYHNIFSGFQEDFTPDMVQQIIKQNSSIVADIEEILHK